MAAASARPPIVHSATDSTLYPELSQVGLRMPPSGSAHSLDQRTSLAWRRSLAGPADAGAEGVLTLMNAGSLTYISNSETYKNTTKKRKSHPHMSTAAAGSTSAPPPPSPHHLRSRSCQTMLPDTRPLLCHKIKCACNRRKEGAEERRR